MRLNRMFKAMIADRIARLPTNINWHPSLLFILAPFLEQKRYRDGHKQAKKIRIHACEGDLTARAADSRCPDRICKM
jgi:hypothetical protein